MMEKMFLLRLLEKLPGFVAHLYSLLAIIVGWVIFAFDSLIQGVKWLQTMIGFTDVPLFRSADLYYLKSYGILLLIGILASTPLCKRLGDAYLRHPVLQTAGLIAIGVLCFANLAAGTYNPFLYFRF